MFLYVICSQNLTMMYTCSQELIAGGEDECNLKLVNIVVETIGDSSV